MTPSDSQSLDERARKLAIQSLKEQARRKTLHKVLPEGGNKAREQVVKAFKPPQLSEKAAKSLAAAIKSMLSET
jgi:hypothetical protein